MPVDCKTSLRRRPNVARKKTRLVFWFILVRIVFYFSTHHLYSLKLRWRSSIVLAETDNASKMFVRWSFCSDYQLGVHLYLFTTFAGIWVLKVINFTFWLFLAFVWVFPLKFEIVHLTVHFTFRTVIDWCELFVGTRANSEFERRGSIHSHTHRTLLIVVDGKQYGSKCNYYHDASEFWCFYSEVSARNAPHCSF